MATLHDTNRSLGTSNRLVPSYRNATISDQIIWIPKLLIELFENHSSAELLKFVAIGRVLSFKGFIKKVLINIAILKQKVQLPYSRCLSISYGMISTCRPQMTVFKPSNWRQKSFRIFKFKQIFKRLTLNIAIMSEQSHLKLDFSLIWPVRHFSF